MAPLLLYFNPRTREGCDTPYYVAMAMTMTISIHAPVKGATQLDKVKSLLLA